MRAPNPDPEIVPDDRADESGLRGSRRVALARATRAKINQMESACRQAV